MAIGVCPNCGTTWEGSEEDTNQGFGDLRARWCPPCYNKQREAAQWAATTIIDRNTEIERLRAELDHAVTNETLLRHDVQRQAATIADLTGSLDHLRARVRDLTGEGAGRYWEGRWRDAEATTNDLVAALRAILDQDTVSDEAEHLRHIAAAALARAQAAEDNDWGCAPLTSGASGWCAHEWFRLPLALRHRWWKETDYGNQHATPELIAECQAALDRAKGGPPEGWTPDRTWQGGKE